MLGRLSARTTLHEFVEAGISLYNPDKPDRPVNSPKAVYHIAPLLLTCSEPTAPKSGMLFSTYRQATIETLKVRYARERDMAKIPLEAAYRRTDPAFTGPGRTCWSSRSSTSSAHGSRLAASQSTSATRKRNTPTSIKPQLTALGVTVDSHGKMPDVVIHFVEKNWLVLIEAVTSHGPVDGKK